MATGKTSLPSTHCQLTMLHQSSHVQIDEWAQQKLLSSLVVDLNRLYKFALIPWSEGFSSTFKTLHICRCSILLSKTVLIYFFHLIPTTPRLGAISSTASSFPSQEFINVIRDEIIRSLLFVMLCKRIVIGYDTVDWRVGNCGFLCANVNNPWAKYGPPNTKYYFKFWKLSESHDLNHQKRTTRSS